MNKFGKFLLKSLLLFTLSFSRNLISIQHNPSKSSLSFDKPYQIIEKKILSRYTRPYTLLELGAGSSLGFFSFQAARNDLATCVMIAGEDKKNIGQLFDQCLASQLDTILLLNKKMDQNELVTLTKCEHFDVICIPDILSYLDTEWQITLDTLLDLGDHIVFVLRIDNSEIKRTDKIRHFLFNRGGQSIGKDQDTEIIHVIKKKDHLTKTSWLHNSKRNVLIESSFKEKLFFKRYAKINKEWIEQRAWHPGINMITFKMLQGIYPTIATLQKELLTFQQCEHTDFGLWNIIIQGKKLVIVDTVEVSLVKNYNPQKRFSFAQRMLKEPSAQKIKRFFHERKKYF